MCIYIYKVPIVYCPVILQHFLAIVHKVCEKCSVHYGAGVGHLVMVLDGDACKQTKTRKYAKPEFPIIAGFRFLAFI